MSTENQPITVLSVYTTFAWVQPVGSGGGASLVITDARYLQKTVPDTATALETFSGGIKTNSIALVSGTELSLPASTTTAPATADPGSSRVVTSQWVRDQGYTTTSGFVTYNGAGPFTTLQTFNAGIKTNSIVPIGSTISISDCEVPSVPIPDNSSRIPNTNWVNQTIGFLYGATTPFTVQQTFQAGIKTNQIDLYSGTTLALPVSTTTTPTVPDSTTRVPTTSWVNTTITNALNATTLFAKLAGTAAFTALQTFNLGIATNSIALVSGTSLALPASTTTTPTIPNNTTLIPTTAWVNTTITNAINAISGFATYAGTTAFTALQTFNLGIATNSIALVSGTSLALPASTTTAPATADPGSSRVVTSQWVRDQGYTNAAGYVTYNGAGPFTTQQNFNAGITSTVVDPQSSLALDIANTTYSLFGGAAAVNIGKNMTSGKVNVLGTGTATFDVNGAGIRSNSIGGISTTGTQTLYSTKTDGDVNVFTLYDSGFGSSAYLNVRGLGLKVDDIVTTNTTGIQRFYLSKTAGTFLFCPNLATESISCLSTTGTATFTVRGLGGIKTNFISSLTAGENLTVTANRYMKKIKIFGTGSPVVEMPIGDSTSGNTSLSVIMNRKEVAGDANQQVYKITTPPSSTRPISQCGEIVISGMNTRSGTDVIYTSKQTINVYNPGGVLSSSTLLCQTYSSTDSAPFAIVTTISSTELRIEINTAITATGTLTQNYIVTLTMYPSVTLSANQNFIIEAI